MLQQEVNWLHGVDVSSSYFLSLPQVVLAADFAADAHSGQVRLTGHAYAVHVIETAAIVEGLLANSARSFTLGERYSPASFRCSQNFIADQCHTHTEVNQLNALLTFL